MALEVRWVRRQMRRSKARRCARCPVRCCAKVEYHGCNSSWNFSNKSMAGWRCHDLAQALAPALLQRIQQNVLAAALGLMGAIHAATALGLAHQDPVGGAVASAGVGLVHQGVPPLRRTT